MCLTHHVTLKSTGLNVVKYDCVTIGCKNKQIFSANYLWILIGHEQN